MPSIVKKKILCSMIIALCLKKKKKKRIWCKDWFPKEQEGKGQSCHYCTKDHDLDECKEINKLDGNTRYTYIHLLLRDVDAQDA